MNELNYSYRNIWFWIFFIVYFSSGFIFFKTPFEFYLYYTIIILFTPIFIIKHGIPKFLLKIFFLPFVVGIIHVLLNNNLPFTFIKITFGLFSLLIFYYHTINHFKFDLISIFEFYCKGTWVLCLIAIIQIVSFYIGFVNGYDYSWVLNKWGFVRGGIIGFRVNSILSEPTYLATVLAPSVYVSLKNLISKTNFIFNKFQSIVIILVSILTTSSIGYFGILLSFLLVTKTFRLRYVIIGFVVTISGFNIAYNYVSDFKQRIDSAKGLWLDSNFNISNTNNSSFVLYNNLHIALKNLAEYPLFGTGLGSHETAFKKHTLTRSLIQYDFEFNVKDGNSLFVRLCTETGLVGLFLVLFFIVKCFIYKNKYDNQELFVNTIISQSLFVLLVLVLIRQGNYMLNGLPLMFLIYYYNFKQYNDKIERIEK